MEGLDWLIMMIMMVSCHSVTVTGITTEVAETASDD